MMSKNKEEIFIGISSCLIGHKVRFDGNHKEQRLITQDLSNSYGFIPVCPEMAIGLGVPRKPIRLIVDHLKQRAVDIKNDNIDVTTQLVEFGREKSEELNFISGYIFKKGSPSCGLYSVKIYKSDTQVLNNGTGLFAQEITNAMPLLPVEEEGRLNDKRLRANFLQRVDIYHRWQHLILNGITKKDLLDFHTQHKFTLLAHCEMTYRHLGKLISDLGNQNLHDLSEAYIKLLMNGLKESCTRGKHINVLEHIAGYFKKQLDIQDKSEFRQLIEDYRSGVIPREALLIMLKHYLRKFPNNYLHIQYYLNHN